LNFPTNSPRIRLRSHFNIKAVVRIDAVTAIDRYSRLTATINTSTSAALRNTSPASTPKPPEYVGIALSSANSIEKVGDIAINDNTLDYQD
jgi:hypothetical protein